MQKSYLKRNIIVGLIVGVALTVPSLYYFGFFKSSFEKEVDYYRCLGYTIDVSYDWNSFKMLEGTFEQLSKNKLRSEVGTAHGFLEFVRIFVDTNNQALWISDFGLDSDPYATERYVHWWTPK